MDEDESISVSGGLAARVTQIRASSVNLITTFGKDKNSRDVLVPLVDWQLFGEKASAAEESAHNESVHELSSSLLALDNLAFLLQDIGFDMYEAVRLLAVSSKGSVGPPESRMRYAARMLRLASKHISAAAEKIDQELLGPYETLAENDV
jgi:hypothetical protein